MEDKVSVIIPTYGRSDLLIRAIDSVLSQSHHNVEIVIVDDNHGGSESRLQTENMLKMYAHDSRVIYYQRDKNGGGAAARNSGIEQATGEYITFLDDDDYYHPEKIEKQLAFLKKENIDVCLCDMDILQGNEILKDNYYKAQCSNVESFVLAGVSFTPMIFMKRAVAVSIGGFFDTPRFQDHVFIYKILKNNFSVGVLHERLAVHNDHEEFRITSGSKGYKGYQNRILFEREFMPQLSKKGQNKLKMIHACIESKITTDKDSHVLGIVKSFTNGRLIRGVETFTIFGKNLVRNIFFKGRHF
ncbi:Spore coat polysaccharide biosynthesis protein spsA [Serratia entomophila]|uniref:Glycosyltransferase family 2 protein n=1 Tax=Serratia entomophila TaxID=42906 RepID=A0ABY5CY64_9GAMM|nr:glycosyltransferase family 2 protein [Serratia entomophila]UIW19890.1 glycosyltransferase family 2 protein [Serratia entomophila]USV02410.1 glycosyltransferase family 2 protein [Serratia entomophila]CAI0760937.1 Spore coat polysaccharide biosynthesis protein spsA [Serratia entomophila]CAI0771557.1 Spore coat polysaccharide biosynthesis protein spsA [Serratia entomophila]CAI0775309.1 Spore coat polysaccharide biosynthesis protein spsA [Serratia entomophila]